MIEAGFLDGELGKLNGQIFIGEVNPSRSALLQTLDATFRVECQIGVISQRSEKYPGRERVSLPRPRTQSDVLAHT